MVVSISTTDALSILDSATIKRTPAVASPSIPLTNKVVSSTWSSDNALLFLASAHTIHRYDPSSNTLTDLYNTTDAPISNMVSKDKASLIFSAGENVHLLDCGLTPKISQTFDSHKSKITSLSLSNDATLLSSTSAGAAHVYNLALGSHIILRGLPSGGQAITTSAFHTQLRTRLLLGIGKQLVVYDTTRPSGPIKTVALGETSSGDITAVVCSPFSKTLVAVATTGGSVGLIDLEKEKGLFRTLNLKVPLTSLEFSPEGAAIYAGTEHGKLLILDLRALDKPPKTIVISEAGCRVEAMSVQRKTKGGTIKSSTDVNTVRRQAQTSKPPASTVASPANARVARAGSGASPARRLPSAWKEGPVPSPKRPEMKKKVFSPVRDPLGNSPSAGDISVEIETLGGLKPRTKVTPRKPSSVIRPRLSVSPRTNPSPSSKTITSRTTRTKAGTAEAEAPRRARTLPTNSRIRKTSTTESATTRTALQDHFLQVPDGEMRQRPRTASSGSHPGSSTSVVSPRSARSCTSSSASASRPCSSSSRTGSSPIPPPLPVSRTVSPELPGIHGEPVTPVPMAKKRVGMSVLGLGTPEVEHWIRAGKGDGERKCTDKGKGKGKSVGFMDENEGEKQDPGPSGSENLDDHERDLMMQISPRRQTGSASWAPAPVSSTGSPAGGAHDFLRTIVRDVMYDFQRETKAEMTGLHLDLVRMGRGWKRELRDLMGEYVGDLKDLREENRRLREENERLRRGY